MDTQLTTQSQATQPEWIDRLFLRLSGLYGTLWVGRWNGVPMEVVKNEWQTELQYFDLQVIKRALDHCRSHQSLPPTLPEFAKICRESRARPEAKPLQDVPRIGVDMKIGREAAAALAATMKAQKHDPLNCFRQILVEADAGTYTNHYGIRMAKEALGVH